LKKDVDREGDCWDFGGRIDLLYGTDAYYAESRGLETTDSFAPKWNSEWYGLALPQIYAEAFVPWGNGVSVKMGHFYAPVGYETIAAPDNFFYSHSYAFQYGEPFTFTGLLASTKFGNYTIKAGLNRGWDNWESDNNALGFNGGIGWESDNKRTSMAIDVVASREQTNPSENYRTLYTLVIKQKLGECWEYVLQNDYGMEPSAGVGNTTARWYGIDQYLYRTISEHWKAGMRLEWFHDGNGSRITQFLSPLPSGDYYDISVGANWTPNENVILRPELRWDWTGNSNLRPFGDFTRSSQMLLDCDLILRF
jgi:hypothetical protein